MPCKLTLLVENTASRCEKLYSEHGLSVFVITTGTVIEIV